MLASPRSARREKEGAFQNRWWNYGHIRPAAGLRPSQRLG
jgi:hypothetical protein